MALKTMSIDKLLDLKSQIEATLASKITDQRRALELELSKLDRFQGAGRGKAGVGRGGARALSHPNTVIPKTQTRRGPGAD
jgi:hypothetical protein